VAWIQRPVAKLLLVLAITLAVFGRVGQLDFLFVDDVRYIHGNPHFNPMTVKNVSKVWTQSYLNLYVPIPLTVWAIESALARSTDAKGRVSLNAAVFHWTNLIIHLANVALVFVILQQLFASSWGSFFGALLFAIQPMQVESIAWVSGLRDVLGAFFSFLCISFFLRLEPGRRLKGQAKTFYAISFGVFFLALLCKPTVVTVPLILAVLAYFRKTVPPKRIAVFLSPFFVAAFFFGVLAATLQSGERLSHLPPPFWTQPLIALDSIWHYLSRLIYPWPLIFDNGHTPSVALESSWLWLRVALPLLLAGGVWFWSRKKGEWTLFLALTIAVLGMLPVSGLKPFIFQFISSVGDRYFYLSMLGASMALAWTFTRWDKAWMPGIPATVILGVFAFVSFDHLIDWKSTQTLFEHNVQFNPRSWYSYNLLGQRARDTGNIPKAIEYFQRGADIGINPEPVTNLAILFLQMKQYDQAIRAFEEAVRLKPEDPGGHQNLGIAFKQAGQHERARETLNRALSLDPTLTTAKEALAMLPKGPR